MQDYKKYFLCYRDPQAIHEAFSNCLSDPDEITILTEIIGITSNAEIVWKNFNLVVDLIDKIKITLANGKPYVVVDEKTCIAIRKFVDSIQLKYKAFVIVSLEQTKILLQMPNLDRVWAMNKIIIDFITLKKLLTKSETLMLAIIFMSLFIQILDCFDDWGNIEQSFFEDNNFELYKMLSQKIEKTITIN